MEAQCHHTSTRGEIFKNLIITFWSFSKLLTEQIENAVSHVKDVPFIYLCYSIHIYPKTRILRVIEKNVNLCKNPGN